MRIPVYMRLRMLLKKDIVFEIDECDGYMLCIYEFCFLCYTYAISVIVLCIRIYLSCANII